MASPLPAGGAAAAAVPTASSVPVAPLQANIEGSIAAPPPALPASASTAGAAGTHTHTHTQAHMQTLDEPVTTTIARDLKRVATKLYYVLLPRSSQSETLKELRDWDLWGPLLLCLTLSLTLSLAAPNGQASLVFASVFVIVWLGAAVVTVNAKLLGGNISFFQSVCVLGYCIFPLVLAAGVCVAVTNHVLRWIIVVAALVWAMRASVVFMTELVPAARRALALYPVALFYVVIAWLVYTDTTIIASR